MPKPKQQFDIRLYLNDILKSIEKIEIYLKDLSFELFSKDEKTQDAVIRNLEIIGEGIKKIPNELRSIEPDIPWKSYAGIRDIIAHYYFGVDINSIWDTAKNDLCKLKNAVESIIKEFYTNVKDV